MLQALCKQNWRDTMNQRERSVSAICITSYLQ